jgi:uncharacterized protein (DUF362 family)/ferredoxin
MRDLVAVTPNDRHAPDTVRESVLRLMTLLETSPARLMRPGARVLVKPYLRNGDNDDPEGLQVSHPSVVAAVVGLFSDCGARVAIGDEGSRNPWSGARDESRGWIHEIARTTGAELTNFAQSGATICRGGLPFPRTYPIAKALLDADLVVNCAHFQLHPELILNGCVKNMFNALIGHTQERLYGLLGSPQARARLVADVCASVRPTLSILDMTRVRQPGGLGAALDINLMLAGFAPASVDTVAARIAGIPGDRLLTSRYGERLGIGLSDAKRIRIRGIHPLPTFGLAPDLTRARRESLSARVSILLRRTLMRPRPRIVADRCDRCGLCTKACPVGAAVVAGPVAHIRASQCIDCHCCIRACARQAIALVDPPAVRIARRVLRVRRAPGTNASGVPV